MAEKPPAFVVVDRRKFTADGEIREGYTAPPPFEEAAPPQQAVSMSTAAPSTQQATQQATQQVALPGAKVVSMPTRSTVEADDIGTLQDRREEAQAQRAPAEFPGAGYDVDGDGLSSEDEALGLDAGLEEDYPEDMQTGPPPSAEERAAQHREYTRLSGEMDSLLRQANPSMKATAAVGFEHIVQSFYLSAIMAMGAGTEPGQKPRIDILGARQSIDMLNVLADKTRGNLDDKERRLLEGVTFELRMMFLELTNAIAAQAQQAPPPGRK